MMIKGHRNKSFRKTHTHTHREKFMHLGLLNPEFRDSEAICIEPYLDIVSFAEIGYDLIQPFLVALRDSHSNLSGATEINRHLEYRRWQTP